MPKTDTTVGGRFSPEEADRIETYAESRGISKSQALRELANAGLDIAGDEGPNLEASGDLSALTDLLDEAGQVQAQIQQKIEAQKQRVERIMRSDGVGHHIVQMTDEEFDKFERRLYSLEEKGMDIRFVRRA